MKSIHHVDEYFRDAEPSLILVSAELVGNPRLANLLEEDDLSDRYYVLNDNVASIVKRLSTAVDLRELTIIGLRDGTGDAIAIAKNLTQLTTLNLAGGNRVLGDEGGPGSAAVDDIGATAIANNLTQLTTLNLANNNIGNPGATAIANNLTQLTALNLANNNIGNPGATAIANNLTQLTALNLANNPVESSGATAIADNLTQLTTLSLANTFVGDGACVAIAHNLTSLTNLDLAQGFIGRPGTTAIAKGLQNLAALNLARNDIGNKGVAAIAENLSRLRKLDLSATGIGQWAAQTIANQLPELTHLNLAHNVVGNGGATAIANGLRGLTRLSLAHTQTGNAGATAIAKSLPRLIDLDLASNRIRVEGLHSTMRTLIGVESNLIHLDLRANPGCLSIDLPEITEGTDARAIIATYRRLFIDDNTSYVRFGEAKLIVLGTEAVGKTSLVRALTTGKACDPQEPKTPGVQHKIFITPWQDSDDQEPIQLNIWDFGGQEMLLQTHRYFLSERSIYIVVHDRREEDARQLLDWIDTAKARAPESPIIVAINKCDDGRHSLAIDLEQLEADEEQLVETRVVHCLRSTAKDYERPPGGGPNEYVDRLRALLLTQVRLMDSPNRLVPLGWVRVRDDLRLEAQNRRVLSPTDFVRICTTADNDEARVTNPDEQRGLLRILHETGVVVAHGLTESSIDFSGIALLDPNWLTTAIYALLADSEVSATGGSFDRDLLQRVLNRRPEIANQYDDAGLDYVISLMNEDRFGLALPLDPTADPPTYLLPEALPRKAPLSVRAWQSDSLRFRYRYKHLPNGLISQFIALSSRLAGNDPDRWRTGCTLIVEGCPVLVTSDLRNSSIEVQVAGLARYRKQALAVVRALLDSINERNPETAAQARVPLPEEPHLDVRYGYLLEERQKHGSRRTLTIDGASRDYSVGELLGDIELPQPVDDPDRWWADIATKRVALATAVVGLVTAIVSFMMALNGSSPGSGGSDDDPPAPPTTIASSSSD